MKRWIRASCPARRLDQERQLAKIVFQGRAFDCAPGQSVLECLTAHGVGGPSACGVGVCQTCTMLGVAGKVDPAAQVGLKPAVAAEGYFLACQFRPVDDVEVSLEQRPGSTMTARVLSLEPLNRDIVRVRLAPEEELAYRAGQFLRLYRDERTSRCYSLASVYGVDDYLELHVRVIPGGRVSGWVHGQLRTGDTVRISQATGTAYYTNRGWDRGLCLLGTGSGLAPLYGIVRDALHQGHVGPVWLFHGSREASGLYLQDELRALAARFANFRYVPCVSEGSCAPGQLPGAVHEVALTHVVELAGWSVHLCGHPEMVTRAKRDAYLAGASIQDIHSDPFLPSGPA